MRLLAVVIALSSVTACEDWQTEHLQVVVRQPPYPRLRCAKGPASLGKLHPNGRPIAGATVVIKPTDLRARTNANGKATVLEVPRGRYQMFVSAPGYSPLPPKTIKTPSQPIELQLQPCISVSDRLQVGFDKKITLRPRNLCGDSWQGATYRWRQLEGPDVAASVTSWQADRLTFTTASLLKARGAIPAQAQVLSFSRDQAGEYVFEIEATNKEGQRSTAEVMVTSTSAVAGLTSVAPFYRYYFVGPETGPWEWKVIKAPKNWQVNLDGAKTRTPSILPRPPAGTSLNLQYSVAIQDSRTNTTFSLVFGAWNVVRRDCGRPECHAAMESHWKATTHARSWQRLLDGKLTLERAGASESCADCHSLGYDREAANGGYDDVADELKIGFPATLKEGNYESLPTPLKEVSNVYCVACHGPARVDPPIAEPPGLYQVGVCARCHDRLPEQDLVAQWRLSKHASTVTGKLNGPDQRPECARCHTAQGFYYHYAKMSRPPSSRTAVLSCCENPAPVSCQACHNAMLSTNDAQLHFHGAVRTASGLKLDKLGNGAGCAVCHNAWHNRTSDLGERSGPHAPQSDLTYGKAGYALEVSDERFPELAGVACAEKTEQGCVTCHMHPASASTRAGGVGQLGGHTFRLRTQPAADGAPAKQHLAACQGCHAGLSSLDPRAKADYDGDGKVESASTEIEGLRALLKQRLEARIAARSYRSCNSERSAGASYQLGYRDKIVVVDSGGRDLGDCDNNGAIERDEVPFTFPDNDLLLHKAAYNDLLIEADGSGGRHNFPYAVKLLQRTVFSLSKAGELPPWEIRR